MYALLFSTNEKHYLKQSASTRNELASLLGSHQFEIDGHIYPVAKVMAEPSDSTAGAMALGGVVGVAGGVPGVIIGGLIGALLGKDSADEDKVKAEKFNQNLL